jgi:hypothetical protein
MAVGSRQGRRGMAPHSIDGRSLPDCHEKEMIAGARALRMIVKNAL